MKYALHVKQSLLFADLSFIGNGKEYFQKALGIRYGFSHCLIREDDMFWNYDNDLLYNRAFLTNKTVNQAIQTYLLSLQKASDDLERTTAKIVKQKRRWQINHTYLHQSFIAYTRAYLLTMPFLFLFWNTERILINQLQFDLSVLFGEEEKDTVLQQVLVPSHVTYFSQERQSLQKIANVMSQNHNKIAIEKRFTEPEILEMIAKHIDRFAFTSFVLHVGNPLDTSVIEERLKEILANEKVLVSEQQQERSDKRRMKALLQKTKSFPEIYERIILAQQLMFWKHQRLDVLFKSDLSVKPLFETIAQQMKLTFLEFIYLRYQEIDGWFRTGKIPSKQVIHKRMQSYSLLLQGGHISLLTNKSTYPEVVNDEKSMPQQTSSEVLLSGMTAYGGKVVGIVRIIHDSEDLHLIQKGEIFVTTMTRPEMIVGLEKAVAFITDQGGVLCHAAIVSREMKKPCIVGTKHATKVLKDGDLIEVDADRGIVKCMTS